MHSRRADRRSSRRPAAEVWERAVTEEGINDELAPILRMTMPAGAARQDRRRRSRSACRSGRSWILLGGAAAGRLRRPLPGRARARPPLPRALAHAVVLGLAARAHRRARRRALAAGSPTGSASSSSAASPGSRARRGSPRRSSRFLFRHRHRRLARGWRHGSTRRPRLGEAAGRLRGAGLREPAGLVACCSRSASCVEGSQLGLTRRRPRTGRLSAIALARPRVDEPAVGPPLDARARRGAGHDLPASQRLELRGLERVPGLRRSGADDAGVTH